MRKNSIATKVKQHFQKFPDAKPKDVAVKFGSSIGNVYSYRRVVLGSKKGAPMIYTKKEIAEAVQVPETKVQTPTAYAWVDYGQFMSREEYRGYLRGRVVELIKQGLQTGYAEAMCCAKKLSELEG